uniref:Ankyrin repeat and zinc finger domain-containing protein 1-like n=1 Tax=Tetraselmis sp. GSL018 TaxID=582737 RepID=A0A061R5G9_9CHLO
MPTVKPKSVFDVPRELLRDVSESKLLKNFVGSPDGKAYSAHDFHLHPGFEAHVSEANVEGSSLTCLTCGVGTEVAAFVSLDEQRQHFKSDWHRFNLKRKLGGRSPLSERCFEQLICSCEDDVESISGSDTASENEEGQSAVSDKQSNSRVFFSVSDGCELGIWRCLLEQSHSRQESGGGYLVPRFIKLCGLETVPRWMVVLASGGHFAAAVFQWERTKSAGSKGSTNAELSVVVHKTFHRYVVRAKAGTRQSTKDSTGKSIKSAGSAMRRANEAALAKDIRETLRLWREEIASVDLIFVHSSRADTGTLFAGADAPLSQRDPRVRRIPFATRRPTFAEAKRVAWSLARVWREEPPPADAGACAGEPSEPLPLPGAALEGRERGSGPGDGPQGAAAAAAEDADSSPAGGASEGDPPAAVASGGGNGSSVTPLHAAARAGDAEEVRRLLESGADPCAADPRGRSPYAVALDRPTRDAFRRFMAAEPDRWDYGLSGIPSALTAEMEEHQEARKAEKNERRKAKEKQRKKAARERKKNADEAAKVSAEAAAAAAEQAAKLKLKPKAGAAGPGKKVGPAGAADAAARQREMLAAAAEARMKEALQKASQQQKLW